MAIAMVSKGQRVQSSKMPLPASKEESERTRTNCIFSVDILSISQVSLSLLPLENRVRKFTLGFAMIPRLSRRWHWTSDLFCNKGRGFITASSSDSANYINLGASLFC